MSAPFVNPRADAVAADESAPTPGRWDDWIVAEAELDATTPYADAVNGLAQATAEARETATKTLPDPIDWPTLFAEEVDQDDYLVDDFWPRGRAISVVADAKAGKSLFMFYICCCLARGVDPWTGAPREPITVAYWDFEMTEDDVRERALDFGLEEADLSRLRYYLLPNVPPLDTPAGGQVVAATVQRDGAQATVFDTFGRVVTGEEDKTDTVRAYYRCTAVLLKQAGISTARLDHTGHTEKNRARGGSGKGEDIDVAWVLKRGDDNAVTFDHRGLTRLRWVRRTLGLTLVEGPPDKYRRTDEAWPEGTRECAEVLERLAVPLDMSANAAQKVLSQKNEGRTRQVVQAAVRYRNQARNRSVGETSGTTPSSGQVS